MIYILRPKKKIKILTLIGCSATQRVEVGSRRKMVNQVGTNRSDFHCVKLVECEVAILCLILITMNNCR